MASMTRTELADRAMDKAQRKIVPFILLMYVLAFLDRANIGFAKQAYQLSTGISEGAFAFGAGIFFIGYALCEVPSNIVMHHVGARVWLARIMITWGMVAAAFAWATTETSFLVLRVLLGIAEAGFFPGIIYFFTFWFSARRRSSMMGLFYFGAPLSFIFGSPLSGMLLDIDGFLGVHGWQWMFVVEGLLASIVGIWALWYLTDRPQQADWIPEDEKQALISELEEENANKPKEGHVGPLVVLANPKVWFAAAIYFTIQISVYGVIFYLPTQVAGLLGKKVGTLVGFVSAIPWVCTLIANAFIPRYSDRSGNRGNLATLLMVMAGLGVIASATGNPLIGIAALCVASAGYFSVQPIFWTMPTRFLSGVAAASAIALINSIGNLGGLIAPNLRVWAEQTFHSPAAGLYALGIAAFVGALLFLISIPLGMGKNTAKLSDTPSSTSANA